MKTTTRFFKIILAIALLAVFCVPVFAEEEYIPVHTEEELNALFSRVKTYIENSEAQLNERLNDTEMQIVTQAFVRSWGVEEYDDPTPKQIDDAYNALFNMSMLLGLTADAPETFSSGALFEYAVQLLDQEYFDLLLKSGEDEEIIAEAEYLRDVAEGLVETPEEFTPEMVEEYLLAIYQEAYLAAALKAIEYTEALPQPEDLYPQQADEKEGSTMMPNPMVEYISVDPLNKMLGISMPELPDSFGYQLGYYSIVADTVAEILYKKPDDVKVMLRLSPERDIDISGVYGASYSADWIIAGTRFEVDTYQTMRIAKGNVSTLDGRVYSFAIDADNVPEADFREVVAYFIERCRNQSAWR